MFGHAAFSLSSPPPKFIFDLVKEKENMSIVYFRILLFLTLEFSSEATSQRALNAALFFPCNLYVCLFASVYVHACLCFVFQLVRHHSFIIPLQTK